jgi:hypothetical protein
MSDDYGGLSDVHATSVEDLMLAYSQDAESVPLLGDSGSSLEQQQPQHMQSRSLVWWRTCSSRCP